MTTQLTREQSGQRATPNREYEVAGGHQTMLHACEYGNSSGPEIVFIHGWSQSELCWSAQVQSLLADTFRIITFDLRGHGRSGTPANVEAYTDARLWSDDLAAVIDETQVTRPVLVGWSYGGFVIGDYLRAYGDIAIAGINLIGASVLMLPPKFPHIGPGLLENVEAACSPDLANNISAMRRFLEACTARQLDDDPYITALCWNMVATPQVRQALFAREIDDTDVLRELSVPVLVTHGRRDKIVLPSMAEHTLANCPTAVASWYEDVGHMPFLEDADRFNSELAAFTEGATNR